MLDELKKLPALPAVPNITKVKRKPNATKKKSRNLIKVTPEVGGLGGFDVGFYARIYHIFVGCLSCFDFFVLSKYWCIVV